MKCAKPPTAGFHSQIICDSEKLMYSQGVAMSVPGASIMRNVPRPSDMLLDVEVSGGCETPPTVGVSPSRRQFLQMVMIWRKLKCILA